jgi:hypothetical protein
MAGPLIWARTAFILHSVVELPAGITFAFFPNVQLPNASPDASLILRSYGGLLLASAGLSTAMYRRMTLDDASQIVALALAFYHVWPIVRAVTRLWRGIGLEGQQGKVLGGPAFHLLVHVGCLAALLHTGSINISAAK